MKKPDTLPMLPGQPVQGSQAASAPQAVVRQTVPVQAADSRVILPTASSAQQAIRLAPPVATPAPEYVDPYLFATGYYASQVEQEALSRTAASRLRLRVDVEHAKPKRKKA